MVQVGNGDVFAHVRTAARILCAVAVIAVPLAGCATGEHGSYTRDAAAKAKTNKDEMSAAAAFDAARQRFLVGELDDALKQVDAALAISPKVAASLLLREQILVEIGTDAGAIEQAARAGVAAAPGDARFDYFLGVFYERQGDTARAEESYLRAAKLDAGSVQYRLAATEMMVEAKKYAQAKEYLQQAITDHPNAPGLLQTMGFLCQIQNEPERAVTYFADALALAPEQQVLRENLAVASYNRQDFARALANLEPLLEKPEFAGRNDLQAMAAKCYIKCARPVEARRILQTMSEGPGKNSYLVWSNIAQVAVLLEDLPLLLDASRHMINLEPQREEGHLALAYYHERNREPQKALEQLRDYARSYPQQKTEVTQQYLAALGG